MKNTDLAYIAGILDGEGCIRIRKEKCRKSSTKVAYMLVVIIVNTNDWLIKWLQFSFGGYVYKRSRQARGWNDCWSWSVSRRQALEFLRLVLPYLRVKKAQAEVAIEFQEAKALKLDRELAVEEAQRIIMCGLNYKTNTKAKL